MYHKDDLRYARSRRMLDLLPVSLRGYYDSKGTRGAVRPESVDFSELYDFCTEKKTALERMSGPEEYNPSLGDGMSKLKGGTLKRYRTRRLESSSRK